MIEDKLIARFNPMWNRPEYKGFGNNDKKPIKGKASAWDMLHPGRKGALQLERSVEALAALTAERETPRGAIFDLFT